MGPRLLCWHPFEARVEHDAPSTRAWLLPDGEPPIARHPQVRAYGGRESPCDSRRPGRLLLLRRLGREVCLSLTRSASSFASITASQKEATASHASSLRTMDWTRAGSERSPPPIASTRTRRCSAQAGKTSTVCSTVSSGRSTQCWHPGVSSRWIRNRYLPKQPCPVSTCVRRKVRTPWRLDNHSSKRGTYRRNGSVPRPGLQQSLSPYLHEILPELRPLRSDLPRQQSFAPA